MKLINSKIQKRGVNLFSNNSSHSPVIRVLAIIFTAIILIGVILVGVFSAKSSKKEADEYMTEKDWIKARETAYLHEKNGNQGFLSNDPQKYSWWTRDVCLDTTKAVYVKTNGSIKDEGADTNSEGVGVRPAMWISIN